MSVELHDTLNRLDLRLRFIPIESEAMAGIIMIQVMSNTTKAIYWELLIAIIVLEYRTNCLKCLLVLIN